AGAIALAGVIVVAILIRAAPSSSAKAAVAQSPAKPGPGLIRLILAYGLFGFGYVVTATFLIAIIRGQPSLKPFEPIAWLVVGLAGAPSIWIWNIIGRRIGLERAFGVSCLVEAVGVLLRLWTAAAGVLAAAGLVGGPFH